MTPPATAELLTEICVDDEARRALRQKAEPASRRHVIYFTPRSGSSWLHAALRATDALGDANEYFNPTFVRSIGRRLQANTLEDYFDALLRAKKTDNDVFTMEITYFQFARIGDPDCFFRWLPPASPSVLLIRQNIVLQAISLYKAVETEVFHAVTATPEAIARSQSFAAYDGDKILSWVQHIRQQEIGFQTLFEREGIAPLRLSYEQMFAPGADPVGRIARHFGVALPAVVKPVPPKRRHRPLASPSNLELERRFRADFPDELARLEQQRSALFAPDRPEPRSWFGWARRRRGR